MLATPSSPRLLFVAAAGIACLVALAPAQAAAQDPTTQEAERLTRELVASRGGLLGLGVAAELVEQLPALADKDAARLLDTASRARLHPLAATLIDRERARFALDHGKRKEANQLLTARGFVLDWSLLGPFPNEGMSAFDQALPPEQRIAFDDAVPTRVGPTRWVALEDRHHLGDVDAEALIRPTENAVIYLAVVLEAPRDTRAVLRTTASTPYRLFVDGAEIAAVTDDPGGVVDRDAWGVSLKRGANLVLVKLANEEGEAAFNLRVTDEAGAPLKGVTASAKLRDAEARTPETFTVTPPLRAFIDAARKLDPRKADARALALARAALLARLYRPEDIGEPALELIREARAARETPEVLRIAAQHSGEHWRRQDAIDRAAQLAPNDPLVALLRARLTREAAGDLHRTEALNLLQPLKKQHPDFIAPRLLELELLHDEGRSLEALQLAMQLVEQHPDHPAVLAAALQISVDLPLMGKDAELYRKRLQLNASNLSLYGPRASQLIQQGKLDEARAVVRDALALRPDITGFYGLAADVERAAGDLGAAEAAMRRLVQLVPGDAGYWSRLGIFLLETGDREDGLSALNRSLELQPQNADLKTYVQHLTPDTVRLQDRYAIAVPDWTPELEATYSSEDLIELLDQTVTRVFPNGLTSTYHQRAWRIRTQPGAERLRYFSFAYTPGSESPTVHKVRVRKPDGAVSESYQTVEQSVSEPWYNLHYDVRAVVVLLPDVAPGDTVEVQYTIDQTASTNLFGDYFGDLWFAQSSSPRLLARYVLLTPGQRELAIRDLQIKHTFHEDTLELDGAPTQERTWEVRDAPAVLEEPGAPGTAERADYLHLSSFTSVEALGRWYWNLVKDQLVVDSEMRQVVKTVTAGLTDRRAIVDAVANWVVQNTRYVGLEFGIHGFKPYRTTLCFRRRFGDCKDKASLIKVMLEEAGVPANIVLIRTRSNGAIDPLPASLQIFDHAIAYVPEFDLFIDGTAEFSGTHELPWGDQDTQVIIVQDGGGVIARRTPVRPADQNLTRTVLRADLSVANPTVEGETTLSGSFAGGWRERYQTPETRKELYTQSLHEAFPGARVTRLELSDLSKLEQPVEARWAFDGARLVASSSPSEVRLLPTLRPARFTQRLASRAERKTILEVGHPFTLHDTVQITPPAGFTLQSPPAPVKLTTEFGAFEAALTQQDGRATFVWTLRVDAWRIPPDKYVAFRRWLTQIDQALEEPLVFKK